jgi:hypothetical protein
LLALVCLAGFQVGSQSEIKRNETSEKPKGLFWDEKMPFFGTWLVLYHTKFYASLTAFYPIFRSLKDKEELKGSYALF